MSHQEAVKGRADSATTFSIHFARKVAVAVIGASVLAFGIALILLPGPAVRHSARPRDSGDRVPLDPSNATPPETGYDLCLAEGRLTIGYERSCRS
jgi:Putative transmembrane protein (PGPGW)